MRCWPGIRGTTRGRNSELSARRLEVFLQARHELDEVARPMAGVELELQDVLPAVLAGRGRPGQREEVGAVGDAADGAALHGGGADLLVAQHADQLAEALDLRSEEHTSELQSLMRTQ